MHKKCKTILIIIILLILLNYKFIAVHANEQYANNICRVGLDEYEWFRKLHK